MLRLTIEEQPPIIGFHMNAQPALFMCCLMRVAHHEQAFR